MEGLAVLAGIRGLVFGRHFNWLQLARERQDEEQRDCTAHDHGQSDGNRPSSWRRGLKMPVSGAPKMREECKDGEKVVRREEELIRRHVKASSGEIEVGVEIENVRPYRTAPACTSKKKASRAPEIACSHAIPPCLCFHPWMTN